MISSKPIDPLRKDSMDIAPSISIAHQDLKTTPMPSRNTTLGGGRDGLRAISTATTKTPSPRMLKSLLERKCHTHIDAINSHDFFEGGSIWLDKSDDWEATIAFLGAEEMGLEEYVDAWKKITRVYPEMRLKCVDMSTDVKASGKAEVEFEVEVTGMPVGVVRRTVSSATFETVGGRWLATRFRAG